MKIGIIGLPNVGKSSLFNLLTHANAQVAKFPFTTIERNVGMVVIPDERLNSIVGIVKPKKVTPAAIEFLDIAGLIKGASKGEGLGNRFLSYIRDVDLIIHLLRCFSDPDVAHTDTEIIPERDYEIVRSELLLADLEMTERRIAKIKKNFEAREELRRLNSIRESLSSGRVPDERVANLPLLSTIPEIVVLNLDEDGRFQCPVPGYKLSVKLEEDILDFTEEEKEEIRRANGLESKGLAELLARCLKKLLVIIFYTIKGEETRAWLVKAGTTVIEAAGMIHTDLKEGFIKSEVLRYDDLIAAKSFAHAQHLGLTKIEGKEYIIQDGDIVLIRFKA